MRPCTPPPATHDNNGNVRSYLIPSATCATCGKSTEHSHHYECKRVNGLLLVEDK